MNELVLMGTPIYFVVIAFPCTVVAIALAILHIYRHLLNYTEPTYQRYIVRIIFMVPVSALFFSSFVFFACDAYPSFSFDRQR